MRYGLFAAFGFVTVATALPALAQDQPADAVASAILHGYVAQDVAQIAPHSNETNQRFFEGLLANPADAGELFEGTRGEAGLGWDGLILPPRYRTDGDRPEAIIPFAIEASSGPASLTSGAGGRYMAIVLTLDSPEDTTWGFEDINYIPRGRYDSYAANR